MGEQHLGRGSDEFRSSSLKMFTDMNRVAEMLNKSFINLKNNYMAIIRNVYKYFKNNDNQIYFYTNSVIVNVLYIYAFILIFLKYLHAGQHIMFFISKYF